MTGLAAIKAEINKIIELATAGKVQSLKTELKRMAKEIKKRGNQSVNAEVKQIEKTVRQVRTRVQKLSKQIEAEVAKIRKLVAKMPRSASTTFSIRNSSKKKGGKSRPARRAKATRRTAQKKS